MNASAYTPAALTALDEIVANLVALAQGVARDVAGWEPAVFDELDAAGDLDAWDALECEIREAAGEQLDPAECDDNPEIWYTAGREEWWLDTTADDDCEFMLGVSEPSWSWNGNAAGTVFVSARRLARRKSEFPQATVPLCIDSGGFTELRMHGGWKTTPEEYVALVRKVARGTRNLEWAAIQDWMVEDDALAATGLTLADHQRLTVESFVTLRELAPEVRWLPVVQGQTLADYLAHVEMYRAAGVDLRDMARVGLGSVCRRHSSDEILAIVRELHGRGIRLHGFGMKTQGLERAGGMLRSSDSLAWSLDGRQISRKTGRRDSKGASLANSQEFAEAWRERMDRAAVAWRAG